VPVTQPSIASRPTDSRASQDPSSDDRSFAVFVGVVLALVIATATAIALVRRTRVRR
jgi:hypothetical protein